MPNEIPLEVELLPAADGLTQGLAALPRVEAELPNNPVAGAGVEVEVDPPNNPLVCDGSIGDEELVENTDVPNVGVGLNFPKPKPEVTVSFMVFELLNMFVVADGVREREGDGVGVGGAVVKGVWAVGSSVIRMLGVRL